MTPSRLSGVTLAVAFLVMSSFMQVSGQSCPPPQPLENGDVTRILNRIDWACHPGFKLDGASSATCEAGGQWSSPLPTCERLVVCPHPEPGRVATGLTVVAPDVIEGGMKIYYRCRIGQQIRSGLPKDAVCDVNTGRLTNDPPVCISDAQGCSQDIPFGSAATEDYGFPHVDYPNIQVQTRRVTWTCEEGYVIAEGGSATAMCRWNDTTGDYDWDSPKAVCQRPQYCDATLLDGTYRGPSSTDPKFPLASTVTWMCNVGYTRQGAETATCTRNDSNGLFSFSEAKPVCELFHCSAELKWGHAKVNNVQSTRKNFAEGETVTWECDPGFGQVGDGGDPQTTCILVRRQGAPPVRMWDSVPPPCSPYNCGDNTAPVNGTAEFRTVEYPPGTSQLFRPHIVYTCNEGFNRRGVRQNDCTYSRTWVHPIGTCNPITCRFAQLFNGEVLGKLGREVAIYKQAVTFRCNKGFSLKGPNHGTCGHNNQSDTWSYGTTLPECIPNPCSEPSPPENGGVEAMRHYVDVVVFYYPVVSYSCKPGFILVGRRNTYCLNNGTLAHPKPVCTPITCDRLGGPDNGFVSDGPQKVPISGSLMWGCNVGWTLRGSNSATCILSPDRRSGVWDRPIPDCIEVMCTRPLGPLNGNVIGDRQVSVMGMVTFTCDPEFELVGESKVTCELDVDNVGIWSHPTPTCRPVTCDRLGAPLNGAVSDGPQKVPIRGTLTWTCNSGYVLEGSKTSTCTHHVTTNTGRWSDDLPFCRPVTCDRLGAPTNGAVIGDLRVRIGGMITFTCDPEFDLVGDMKVTCELDVDNVGIWSGPAPTCRRVTCDRLGAPLNGAVSDGPQKVPIDGTLTWTCDSGYVLEGSRTSTCTHHVTTNTGRWSDDLPFCRPVYCDRLGAPANGTVAGELRVRIGGMLTWTCNMDFELEGARSAICQLDETTNTGKWSEDIPRCKPLCEERSNPKGGTVTATGRGAGDTETYECGPERILVSVKCEKEKERVCLDNGSWSCPPPTCPVPCESNLPRDFEEDSRPVTDGIGAPPCGQTAADVVVICDQSTSMRPDFRDRLHSLIEDLDRGLRDHAIGSFPGIRNQYSLVGFGRFHHGDPPNNDFTEPYAIPNINGDHIYDVDGFGEACQRLVTEGNHEDGYFAMKFALEDLKPASTEDSLRYNVNYITPLVILVSDEDRDEHRLSRGLTRTAIKRMIRQKNAVMEAIVDNWFIHGFQQGFGMDSAGMMYMDDGPTGFTTIDPGSRRGWRTATRHGYLNTRRDYTTVALELGGAAWDFDRIFRTDTVHAGRVAGFVNRTVAIVENRVHKCCSCLCRRTSPTVSFLECQTAEGTSECKTDERNVFTPSFRLAP